MGSLAFAAGGAIAGAGEGLETVGKNELTRQREEGLERMRAQHQSDLAMETQSRQEQFAEHMHSVEHGEAVAAAGAQREFLTGQEKSKEAAALERVREAGKYRVAARRAGVQEKPPPSPMQHQGDYTMYDPAHPDIPPTKIPVYRHTQSGRLFVSAGNIYLPFDSSSGKLPDSKSVARPPANATADLMKEPTPEKMNAYLDAYGQLPAGFFDAQRSYAGSGAKPGQGPLGKAAPSGATWQPAAGAQNAAEDEQEDADADNEAASPDPYGQHGAPTSSPEDNMPAQ